MKRKFLSIILMGVMSVMLLAGCKQSNVGTPEDNAVIEVDEDAEEEAEEERLLVGYSCVDLDNPYYSVLEKAMEVELQSHEISLLTMDADRDVDLQIEQIQDLIDAQVSAVFLCPVDREKVTPALEALKEAKIPVINIETEVSSKNLIDAFIGSDNREAGTLCGKDLGERMPDGGNVAILESPSVNAVNERITGFENAVKDKGFQVVARQTVDGSRSDAVRAMDEIITKAAEDGQNIDAVMCGNDEMALGAVQALEEAGYTSVHVYGVDGSPQMKQELVKAGTLATATGAQSPINIGKRAVEICRAILNGEKFSDELYEPTFLIDRDNVSLYGTDGWQ